MFVAYLVPKHDSHLVYEDGLGYLAKGSTAEEAKNAVLAQLRHTTNEPYTDEEMAELLEENALHVVEL